MFVADTGDLTSASPTLAGALIFVGASVMVAAVSSWLNRRPKRRRTGPAPTSPDQLKNSSRLDAHDAILTDLNQRVTRLEVGADTHGEDDDRRFKRIEDRLWPPT